MTTSARAAASRGDWAIVAPFSRNGSALAAFRFHTVTAKPAPNNRVVMPVPITPSPRNPMVFIGLILSARPAAAATAGIESAAVSASRPGPAGTAGAPVRTGVSRSGRTRRRVGLRGPAGCRPPPGGVDLGASPLLALARANLGDPLRERDFQLRLRPRRVVEVGNRHARQPPPQRPLDVAEIGFLVGGDE